MDLLDSDIFVLDLRFPRDPRFPANKRLLEARETLRATTIFNLLEVCGILSFNLSREALLTLYASFSTRYGVEILLPSGSSYADMVSGAFSKIAQKMAFGDAQILWLAEQRSEVDRLISWNAIHFEGRTRLSVVTPQQWVTEHFV